MVFFPENSQDWKRIARLVEQAETVFISTHVNPDGDAIGSVTGFAACLRHLGRQCRAIIHSPTPKLFGFLDPDTTIESLTENGIPVHGPKKGDLVVMLDLGTYARLGTGMEFLFENEAAKVVIDHHIPEPVMADVVVVNTRACSTGSLVFDFFLSTYPMSVSRVAALGLMTALVTDTGFFGYSNTTATSLQIAASLCDYGISTADIRNRLESKYPLYRQKLLGMMLADMAVTTCGRVAYSVITRSMFRKSGASREHTENIINHLRVVEGIQIAILFIEEDKNIFKTSFRSAGEVPVHIIAHELGGGGHRMASGAHVRGSLEEVKEQVLRVAAGVLDCRE